MQNFLRMLLGSELSNQLLSRLNFHRPASAKVMFRVEAQEVCYVRHLPLTACILECNAESANPNVWSFLRLLFALHPFSKVFSQGRNDPQPRLFDQMHIVYS